MVKNLLHQLFHSSILETSDILQTKILSQNMYRALLIPVYDPPSVLEDSIDNMQKILFYNDKIYTYTFDHKNVFILSQKYTSQYNQVNFFANSLIKAIYPNIPSDNLFTIYGPTILVGLDEDSNYSSLPYSVLDATLNLITRFNYDS
jgi:hypothetical protein